MTKQEHPEQITEADADKAIAVCDGDPPAVAKALPVAGELLSLALKEARKEASWGDARGRPSRRREVQ